MRKEVFFVLILVISIMGFVSADCSESQLIMRLSSASNAHGALFNQSYSYQVCFNNIFGESYTGSNALSNP